MAEKTFQAFKPFINLYDPGVKDWKGSPIHTITKEDWRLFRRYRDGERQLTYSDGRGFKPGRDVVQNIYSARHVHWHILGRDVTYYTSGKNGFGLLYLDVDAHHSWQTDEYAAKALLQELFPFAYYRASRRGQNGFLKIRYSTFDEFNALADRLQAMVGRYFLSKGILCDFEVKGKISTTKQSGSLAKNPFGSKNPCNMRDATDNWDWRQLEIFSNSPIVNTRRIEQIMGQIQIDDEKAAAFAQHKRQLHEAQKVLVEAKKTKPVPQSPLPVIIKPVAKPSVKPCSLRARVDLPSPTSDDAFRRNLTDLPPFVRAIFSEHRRYPTVDEALDWLHANGRYSGEWEDGESGRARRVQQILDYLERDFNPELLGNGSSVSLQLGQFGWWVEQKFGSTMTAKVKDISRSAITTTTTSGQFDAITVTAPTSTILVPARFVETFLAVVEFCLREDPLANKAVPTNRIKKIWAMVKGGAAWNQKYFQIVRDRLHRMGVIRIFDKHHSVGKAWRWMIGENFPETSLGEQQKELKEKSRLPRRPAVSLVEFLADIWNREEQIHNTLYYDESQFSAISLPDQQVRPPPWSIPCSPRQFQS